MNRSSFSLVVAIALAASTLAACTASSTDDPSSDEDVAATTQGLRNCTGVCDDLPHSPPSPPSPPSPSPPFPCNSATQQIAPSIEDHNVYACWNITNCHYTPRIVYGPVCTGYTFVSQSYCSYGLHMSCDPLYGTCRCR